MFWNIFKCSYFYDSKGPNFAKMLFALFVSKESFNAHLGI